IPEKTDDELGHLVNAVNTLSLRTHTVFSLIDKMQQSSDIESTFDYLWPELKEKLRVDCLLSFDVHSSKQIARLKHMRPRNNGFQENIGKHFGINPVLRGKCLDESTTVLIEDLRPIPNVQPANDITAMLSHSGMITALFLPIRTEENEASLLILCAKQPNAFADENVELLRNLAGVISHGFGKSAYTEKLMTAIVNGLAKLAENRDYETGDHLIRMSLYSGIIAEKLRDNSPYSASIDEKFVKDVEAFAPMHDIGKVGVPDSILLKPGKLTEDETLVMQRHPTIGGEVLRHCASQLGNRGHQIFNIAIEIAEGHHEKFDGSGYPRGLSGEDIPLAARIIAVADVFDALSSKRPYKAAWPLEKALDFLTAKSGSHFDPAVIDALKTGFTEIQNVYEQYKHV
ncbi:MAG: HD domain-containing protein, partial [Gammaproteobacteria bacterium]|nr:HD domain-containing protein [Gammaproteobacteria bacterium]